MLSFIPPDGRFKLLEYESSVPLRQLPFSLQVQIKQDETGGTFLNRL